MVLLWILRDPKFIPGWDHYLLARKYCLLCVVYESSFIPISMAFRVNKPLFVLKMALPLLQIDSSLTIFFNSLT